MLSARSSEDQRWHLARSWHSLGCRPQGLPVSNGCISYRTPWAIQSSGPPRHFGGLPRSVHARTHLPYVLFTQRVVGELELGYARWAIPCAADKTQVGDFQLIRSAFDLFEIDLSHVTELSRLAEGFPNQCGTPRMRSSLDSLISGAVIWQEPSRRVSRTHSSHSSLSRNTVVFACSVTTRTSVLI